MECRNCPYGKEDFDRRMAWYNKIVEERGIPNDIYGYETYEDAVKDAEQFLWCDKVGGKVYCFGRCTDAYSDIPKHENRSKKKRRNKRERYLKHKQHLKHLHKVAVSYPPAVIYTNEIYVRGQGYVENPKPYYKRIYRSRGGGSSPQHKKASNRKIRRYKGEIPSGYWCHKLYDYWWEMY